jgi:hypothetical protein
MIGVKKSRLDRVGVLLVLAVFGGLAGTSEGASAGAGTVADPYRNVGPSYVWTYQGAVTALYQDMTVTASIGQPGDAFQFWAFNMDFSSTGLPLFYTGIQRKGFLLGDGVHGVPVLKSAYFSLRSNGVASGFRMLESTNCVLGFDSPDPTTGVSCAISYNWAQGQQFRLRINVYEGVNTPGWCPTSVTTCTVYQAVIGPSSNPSAAIQISAWSVAPAVYGRVSDGNSFLENGNVVHRQNCSRQNNVDGHFVIPFKLNGSNTYAILKTTGGDRFELDHFQSPPVPVLACVWWWNDALASRVTY